MWTSGSGFASLNDTDRDDLDSLDMDALSDIVRELGPDGVLRLILSKY